MKAPRTTRRIKRGNPFLEEKVHDPYQTGQKLRDGVGCPECKARYRNGRWIWPKQEAKILLSHLCPACRRIADRYPAGELRLSGNFFDAHRDEILTRVRHVEELERRAHPLHRIIDIERDGGTTVVTTTDIHLPHSLGHALRDAWAGELSTRYDLDGYFTRVSWSRED